MKTKLPILPLLHKSLLVLSLLLLPVLGSGSAWGQSPVELTTDDNENGIIDDSEKRLYLIQTNAFPSFFIAPQANNTITTNNILGEYMLWYFLDAGTDNDTQYYYIVNNSTGKYIYNHNGNSRGINITDFAALSDANKEKCKFKIVANENNTYGEGFYNINVRANQTYYGLNKQNGSQSNQYPIRLTNNQYINDFNSKWKFIRFNGTFTWPAPPFTPSTDLDKHYYEIHNIQKNTYYAAADATADTVIFTNQANESRAWYLKEAASDTWYKYYYIINPATGGKYMYYNGTATNGADQQDAVSVKAYDSANEDRYQFIVVQAARGDMENNKDARKTCYAIIPKLLIDNIWTSSSIGYAQDNITNGLNMGIINSRGASNGAHWDFITTTFNTVCGQPVIAFDRTTGKASITTTTLLPTIYYTTDETTPSTSNGTSYNGPFTLTEQTTVKAIVTKEGYTNSDVTTLTIYKVATPTIQQEPGTHNVSITTTTPDATIYYTIDGTTPTTSSTLYTGASQELGGKAIKAIAVKDNMINSDIGEGTITIMCATPVISFDNATSTVTITCETEGSTIHYTIDDSEPTNTSTTYTGPFSVTSPTTVKAIATHGELDPSNVAELVIPQVATPTIQNNGSNAISITTATPDATIYYTTDGSTPTTSSTEYTEPLTDNVSNVTIKAIAVKAGMITSAVGSGTVMLQCAAPVISFDDATSKVSIITATEGSTIYYTTDGGTPSTSSTAYSEPFSVNATTTVKAITTNPDYTSSTVTESTFHQVATPTIQNNGSNAISITTATDGATIHYTIDGSTPSTSSTVYTIPLTENVSNVTIKAIAVKAGMVTSAVGSGTVMLQCATPVITRDGLTFILSCSMPTDANFYYTLGGGSETLYTGPVAFTPSQLPMTVTAVARHSDYTQSETASTVLKNGEGTPEDPYLIYSTSDFTNFVTNVNNGTTSSACYKLEADVSASGMDAITTTFTGTFDGDGHTISGLGHALFNSINGGVVKNVMLDNVNISGGTNAGAIANQVTGTSSSLGSIYNCGILSGSVSGSGKVGSIVGQLGDANDDNCYARVINCFSYATVSGGSDVGGIVGYNDFASTAANIRTMVMNCMFYGDITSGTSISPVYGGEIIDNLQGGLNNFNYYAYSQLTTAAITMGKYNCALAVEDKYLNRFEFYRLLLNSNKKLAAFYATGSSDNADQKMLKWVLETADLTIANPKPYPVLKAQGYYPSIINPDFANAPDSATVGRNHGGKLGRTLSVTINSVGSNAPSGASITTDSLTLQRTDKDFDRFNYNYDKVQLPYYSEVGTGNYTDYKVVTGWKITDITAVADDPYTSANYPTTGITDYPNHNYADRMSSNKDLYSVSGRIFSQGAYFDVPYGVISITIEPYWGNAIYVADQYYDVVYKNDYSGKQGVSQVGTQVSNSTQFNGQSVKNSITGLGSGTTVYDNAVVLVGNFHLDGVPSNGTTPFTMMSVDENNDHEPDYSLVYHHKGRLAIAPIRFDFLNIIGTAQAQKPNNANLICNFTAFKTKGWFEVTNTSILYSSQLEYENLSDITKSDAPLILLGGVIDQFVSTQSSKVNGNTIYIHVGSNVWIKEFGMGTHSDGSQSTPHVPVSVTGGEFPGFYLTGTYKADATVRSDNAECYISGGYFHEAAGASLEQIDGNVRWQIYNADIDNFFGGGINDTKPITGDVTVDIFNSHVTTYCGGPKFGNMTNGKKVTTNAKGCVFGTYFGAGYGGTSLAKKKYYDLDTYDWNTLQGYFTSDRGKYYNGTSTGSSQVSGKDYGKKGPGVATDFDYEFFVWTSGTTGARLYVKFASFSLAQCDNVESNLKNCIVDGNFYGGGSLGKVVGTVTSVLDGCTVKGNVYGAGYSASLPTLQVRVAGFTTNPNYNSASGMFEPGVFSGTTEYHWKHVNSLSNNSAGTSTSSDSNFVHTTVDLNNLGSVQTATLTLKGTTVVGTTGNPNTGDVFGGGESSAVIGNTQVLLKGATHVLGNVFGGGDEGAVNGNTEVRICDDCSFE